MTVAARTAEPPALAPFSLRDAPSFIERQFPVGRLSAEAYKERKAGAGQTLTALGSYWKGRKPLILVRAVILGCLLPATNNAAADLDIFLKLMAMDDAAFGRRFDKSAAEFARILPGHAELVTEERGRGRAWRDDLSDEHRIARIAEGLASLPYADRVKLVRRPEECEEAELLASVWADVNRHLGTDARSLPQLVEQLGVARYGHRPKVGDTFCGGGSIPFEAARVGCDVYASDLNPIACMLTWGAFNIVGASKRARAEIAAAQNDVAAAVDAEITQLGIEHDAIGNRAKAYLYCLETRCPKTGWMVPMASSWVIATNSHTIAKLVPDYSKKRYAIEVCSQVSSEDFEQAKEGTLRGGRLVHPINEERSGVEIATIRGDYREGGANRNRLRQWDKSDFVPRPGDVFQERLYCVLWIARENRETFFASVTDDDLARERKVEAFVRENLGHWQETGLVPDMAIEPGDETTRLFRERGWTHWHHLFSARQLLFIKIAKENSKNNPALLCVLPKLLNRQSKLCMYDPRNEAANRDPTIQNTFSNQALNTLYFYGVRGSGYAIPHLSHEFMLVSFGHFDAS